jgi:hypothetical protein
VISEITAVVCSRWKIVRIGTFVIIGITAVVYSWRCLSAPQRCSTPVPAPRIRDRYTVMTLAMRTLRDSFTAAGNYSDLSASVRCGRTVASSHNVHVLWQLCVRIRIVQAAPHTVGQAYFALHETLHKVQNLF